MCNRTLYKRVKRLGREDIRYLHPVPRLRTSNVLPLLKVACCGTCFNLNRNLIRKKVNERDHIGVLGVDGRIMIMLT